MNLNKTIALVTGGTSGIGKEIVKQLLIQGSNVVINYGTNDKQANETLTDFKEYSSQILLVKANVTNEEEIIEMFNKIKVKYGKLDVLVNNAGTNVDGYIENYNVSDWDKVLNVNLKGKFICTKHAIPHLKKSNNASIINISSRLGTKPCAEASAYCASEAAIINFTKCSAIELAPYNIRVNCVSPSLTITKMALSGWSKEEIEQTKEKNPMKRLGEPLDIANIVLYLISDKASYITGENINVNGGALL